MSPEDAKPIEHNVFLNVPFDKGYEQLFITLVGALVCLGLSPRCALEISDVGQGRLNKIQKLLEECRVSVHDLSRVGVPVRFNMPFELGLAYSHYLYGSSHDVILLESKSHRLAKTLSDLRWIDPLVHQNRCGLLVTRVLDAFVVEGKEADPVRVNKVAKQLRKAAELIKSNYSVSNVYCRSAYLALVSSAVDLAVEEGLITA